MLMAPPFCRQSHRRFFGALRNLGNNLKRLQLSDDSNAQNDLRDGGHCRGARSIKWARMTG
jgi:hypothetical protein